VPEWAARPDLCWRRIAQTKYSRCRKRSRDPKAQAAVAAVRGVYPEAIGRAEVVWIAEPGTATDDVIAAIAAVSRQPRRAIRWRAIETVVDAIFSPLKDVTHHVVEAEAVRRERADRGRLFGIPLAATTIAVGVILADVVAPWISCRGSGTGRILIFGFGQQAIGFAGDFRKPSNVLLRVVLVHIDHRLQPATPAGIVRRVIIATTGGDAGVPIGKCQFIFRYGERF
jgi:hypothetical protein